MLTIVTSSFPLRQDGSEAAGSFVADLAEELSSNTSVCVVAPGTSESRDIYRSIEVFRYRAPARPLSTLRLWHPQDLRIVFDVMSSGMKMTRAAATGASGILACWGLPCGYWAKVAAKENSIPYSTWLLGSDVWTLGRIPLIKGMLARVIQGASNVYADGFALAAEAAKISGKDIAFLPSTRKFGGWQSEKRRSQAPFRFLFLGRWHRNKGIDLLLEALELLNDDDWSGIDTFEIQGGGPLESLVRSRVNVLESRGRAVKLGAFLSKDEAEKAIANSDWVVIPSRIESIPVIFSDAMKMSRPVVATPVGDLPRLMREWGCGIECRSTEPQDIAHGLREAICSKRFPDISPNLKEIFSLSEIARRVLDDLAVQG